MNDTPLKVLIADDELPLREELRLFPWEDSGAVLIAEARNGEEAFRLCLEKAPDVVVTDISMPIMDGLELCRLLKDEMPRIQVILLTCHSEFHFAKEALKLGALDYLVKGELENEQLQEVLVRARQEMEKDKSYEERRGKEHVRKRTKRFAEWMQSEESKRIPLNEQLEGTGLAFVFPARLLFLNADIPLQDRPLVEMELQEVIDQVIIGNRSTWEAVPLSGGKCLLLAKEPLELPELVDRMESLMAEINAECDRRPSLLRSEARYYAVISDPVQGEQEFHEALLQFDQWHAERFYKVSQKVFIGSGSTPLRPNRTQLAAIEERMRKQMFSLQELSRFITEEFTEWAVGGRYDPSIMKQLILKWRNYWYTDEEAEAGHLEAVSKRILEAATLPIMTAELLAEAGAKIGNGQKKRAEIIHAQRLLEQRLQEDWTVERVANEVGLRDHYFSRMFREETGESFRDYLLRLRLDKAVILLKSTNLKVYEVAEHVGIPNYKYFSGLFRKRTGRTPTEYKWGP